MKIFSRTQNTTKRKKTKQKIYVRMQVLHELMSLLNFCKAKKKDISTAEFFSEVSKRQRNPIKNLFKFIRVITRTNYSDLLPRTDCVLKFSIGLRCLFETSEKNSAMGTSFFRLTKNEEMNTLT